MKFSRREDVAVPLDVAFREMTDFDAFTRAALRRGADVRRTDSLERPGPGMSWTVRMLYRSRARELQIRVQRLEINQSLQCSVDSVGLLGTFLVDFVELSREKTRISVSLELRAATMTSRLILQSARLAKGSLDKRFAKRVTDFARTIEARYAEASLRG